MIANRLAFGVLAVACVVAAGGGAYVAVHRNSTAPPLPTTGAWPATTPEGAAARQIGAGGVAETEAVIDAPIADAPATPTPDAERIEPKAANVPVKSATQHPSRQLPTASTRRVAKGASQAPQTASATSSNASPASVPTDQGWSGVQKPWPSGAAAADSPSPTASEPPTTPKLEEKQTVDVPSPPPQKMLEELVVSAESVIGLQIDTPITSERARVEDRVEARTTRDVKVGERVAFPAGSQLLGSVTLVERGGKFKERARLGIRFHTLVLADGTRLPLSTETLYREGASPSGESAAKVGGAAVGGAILGAIFGGKKGAIVGGATGAAGGTAAVMSGDPNPATLPAGTTMTVKVQSPVTVTVER